MYHAHTTDAASGLTISCSPTVVWFGFHVTTILFWVPYKSPVDKSQSCNNRFPVFPQILPYHWLANRKTHCFKVQAAIEYLSNSISKHPFSLVHSLPLLNIRIATFDSFASIIDDLLIGHLLHELVEAADGFRAIIGREVLSKWRAGRQFLEIWLIYRTCIRLLVAEKQDC
jgi:hypothetical protein